MKLIFKLIGYVVTGLILFFIVVTAIGYVIYQSKESSSSDVLIETNTSQIKKENWRYTTSFVGIDKEKMLFIETTSLNSLDLKFPYNGINRGELTIRKSKGEIDVIFTIRKGQILCDIYTCKGKIKFDSLPSIQYTGMKPSDGSSNMIFLNGSSNIIQKIKNSKKLKIEIEMYREGNQVLEFNIENLNLKYLN